MQPTDYSTRVRAQRDDLTDYVVHLTKPRLNPKTSGLQVLIEILETGYIRPTFARYKKQTTEGPGRPGIKGPFPAVCLTEQPISAILKTLKYAYCGYSGHGIAYYKPILYDYGARPVLYASDQEIGQKIGKNEEGWEGEKENYKGGLCLDLQYLWVKYDPLGINVFQSKLDFTWEREWRVKFPNPRFQEVGLPIAVRNPWSSHMGALIVALEAEIPEVQSQMQKCQLCGAQWTSYVSKVISLEKAAAKLRENDQRFARLETWPDKE